MNTARKQNYRFLMLPLALGALTSWSQPTWAQDPGITPIHAPVAPPVAPVMPPVMTPPVASVAVPMAGTDSTPPDVASSVYVLAPFDQIEITVENQPDISKSAQLLADGTFTYPVVGNVKASGLNVAQLTELLTRGLSRRYNQPQVTVSILQAHTRKIVVTGDVHAPGQYDWRPGLRMVDVIAMSGGPIDANYLTSVTLLTDRGAKSIPVDLVALLDQGDQSQNYVLSPGDTLLFSPRDPATAMIHVSGEVNHPGNFSVVPGGTTVMALLAEAGGQTPAAALSKSQLLHNGQVTALDLHPLQTDLDDSVGKTKLVAGDTLLIPANKAKIGVYGEVRAPGIYYIPDGEQLPLTQALLLAGGPTNDGDKKVVGIIHKGPNGQRVVAQYNIQGLLQGDAKVPDVNLQPGDIIAVPTRHHTQSILQDIGSFTGLAYGARALGYAP